MALPRPIKPAPFTYREYALLPDDGKRHELIDGDFFVTPAPSSGHQTVSRRLLFALMEQLEKPGLAVIFDAPFDVIFSNETVVQPDLVVVRASRKGLVTTRGLEGLPDIAVEIVSPGSRTSDLFLKKALYARHRVPEYWTVQSDPAAIAVFRLVDAEYQLARTFNLGDVVESGEFTEVGIPVTPLFAPL